MGGGACSTERDCREGRAQTWKREDKREEEKKGRLRKKQEEKMQQKIKQEMEKKNREEVEHVQHKKRQQEVEQEKVIDKGEEKEERKQQVAAGNGVLAASQVIQGRGLSEEKDADASELCVQWSKEVRTRWRKKLIGR